MATLLSLCFLASLQASKEDDAAVAAALDAFKTAYKAKEPAGRAGAVAELAKTHHDKVYSRLGQLLQMDVPEVRVAAAKGLGDVTANRKRPVAYLVAALPVNSKEPMTVAAILEALGKLKEPPAQQEVEKFLKTRNTPICKAAVEALGSIGSRSSVGPLIDCLRWLEESAKAAPSTQGLGGGGGGGLAGLGGGGPVDRDSRDRERMVKPVLLKALTAITKENHPGAMEWESWWRSNSAKFLSGK